MQTAIVCRCFTKEFVKAARLSFLVVGVPIILHLLFQFEEAEIQLARGNGGNLKILS